MKRAFAGLSLIILILLPILNGLSGPARQTNPDPQFFPETGKRIANEFWDYWRERGGLAIFGYPISDLDYRKDPDTGVSIPTQWFERNRLELHTRSGGKTEIQLGPLGKELRAEALAVDPDFQPAAKLLDPDQPADTQAYFDQTKHNLHNRFLQYWNENGGAGRFGLPISEERLEFEPETGNYYLTQWFERARFEYHPENKPPTDVLFGLLGNQIIQHPASFDFLWKLGHRSSFLAQPNAIYGDNKGNVYVADRGSGRVNKYGLDQKLINFWYMEGGTQAIARPRGNSAGNNLALLYEVAPNRRDVRFLQANGHWQSLALSESGDPDSLSENQSLAVDGDGSIYLLKYARSSNYLVWKYNPQGQFIGKYVERREVQDPTGLAVFSGKLYLADGISGGYKVFSTDNATPAKTVSLPPAKDTNKPGSVISIATDTKGNVFVGQLGRVLKFDENGTQISDFGAQFGQPGRGIGQLLNSLALFVDDKGTVFVADPANHRINFYAENGNYQNKIIDEELNLSGRLAAARGLALCCQVLIVYC